MPAALRLVLPLLVLLSAVSAHPVVDLRGVVTIDGEHIEIEITATWEDVVSLGGVVPDIGPAYGLGALQRADAVFRDRLVQGLVLSGADGRRLALSALPPAGVPLGPGEALSAEDLTALPWTLRLQGQRPEDPLAVQAQIEVGARRSRIAFSLAVRVVLDGRELPGRLWAEGLPYLLCDERPQDPALLAEPHPALRTGFAWLQPAARGLRVEVLVPWLLIAEELGIPRDDPALITPVDRARLAAAATQVEPWLDVDAVGEVLTPQLVELRQFALDGEDADPTEVLPLATTRIGLVLEADWQQRPAAVTVSWRLFGRILDSLELAVMDRPEEDARLDAPGQAQTLALPMASEPVLSPLVAVAPPREARLPLLAMLGTLTLFLAVLARRRVLAILSLVVAVTALLGGFGVWRLPQGPSLPSEPAAVLQPLLERIYAAVAAGDDAALYDRLASATTGTALTSTFRDLAGALRDRDQGGAWVAIDAVEVEQAGLAVDGATLAGTCRWQVASRVLHWGHVHHRATRVEARLRLTEVDGSWLLSELQITDRGRVRAAP